MSGGHFSINNSSSIADELETIVKLAECGNEYGLTDAEFYEEHGCGLTDIEFYKNLKPETKNKIKEAINILRLASIYTNRIDYLFSDDDGEESFHKRLKEECDQLSDQHHI